ncbi:hypothetical protein F4824DRAFT_422866 [Ustulina deusta]|nr:hypothetical protein F4824DRAFT_422866 [Ustulina deusta]
MLDTFSRPTFWLEFRLLSDGLETPAVQTLPLTAWHKAHNPFFHLFSALPTELRLKVWEYLIAPRIVGIACLYLEDGSSSVELQRDELWGSHPVIRPSVPVLLHVSRETRALALKHYELSFEWKVPRVLAGADLRPPAPVRSPILAAPAPPPVTPQSPHPSSTTNLPGASSSHMSSYHDLLDPSPEMSTSFAALGSARAGAPLLRGPDNNGPERRTSSPPRTWFNFDLDAVYLLGELEPYDSFGLSSPMTYFIPSQTARRVRKTAVSFAALRYGETGAQQIFGALFHVVDRFAPPLHQKNQEQEQEQEQEQQEEEEEEVLVCVTERDEWVNAMIGNDTALVDDDHDTATNVVQKIWRDWYRGAIVTSPLANLRFSLIREKDLEKHVYDFMVATPAAQRKKKRRWRKGEIGATKSGG